MDVHHVALRTRRFDELVAFYRDVMMLTVVQARDGSTWLSLVSAVLMIERREDEEPDVPAGTMELLALRGTAAERETFRERCRELGIAIEAETEHTVYVRDPDGRRVAVSSYPLF